MHIAVTGGSGQIGTAVISLGLSNGHRLINIDRLAPKPHTIAATVPHIPFELVKARGLENVLCDCDALIHLAALARPGSGVSDYEIHRNNVVGTYNALHAAATVGIRRICQASSVNAIGHAFSRRPQYDYFPIDECHPTYCEDAYSLSKWIGEQQAAAIARRWQDAISIASLRFHWVVTNPSIVCHAFLDEEEGARNLWGYTNLEAAAQACLLSLVAPFRGHEVFLITAPDTAASTPSRKLAATWYPQVPIRGTFQDRGSFFDTHKAQQVLGWLHPHSG